MSGYHYHAAVSDVHGAEMKSVPQGNVCLCCPCAGLRIGAFGPSFHTYFSLLWTLCVLTGWAEVLNVGAAGAIGL